MMDKKTNAELIEWCRMESDRNARMQGDKKANSARRRRKFRYRNHMLAATANRIEELEQADKGAKHDIEALMESLNHELNENKASEQRIEELDGYITEYQSRELSFRERIDGLNDNLANWIQHGTRQDKRIEELEAQVRTIAAETEAEDQKIINKLMEQLEKDDG